MEQPTVTAGFLAGRLAKASAVPAEQRGADVRAFIESCALQAELAEELALPEGIGNWDAAVWPRWTAAAALKLVRSHFVSPSSAVLAHSPQVLYFAIYSLYQRTSWGRTGECPADLGRELAELLAEEPGLQVLAYLAAGICGVSNDRGWETGGASGDS